MGRSPWLLALAAVLALSVACAESKTGSFKLTVDVSDGPAEATEFSFALIDIVSTPLPEDESAPTPQIKPTGDGKDILPGEVVLAMAGPPGYLMGEVAGEGCSSRGGREIAVEVAAGSTTNCELRPEYAGTGTLTIESEIEGGPAAAGDFGYEATWDGPLEGEAVPLADEEEIAVGVESIEGLTAGVYGIVPVASSSNYDITAVTGAGCLREDDVLLATITKDARTRCVIRETYQLGTLALDVQIDGGDAKPEDFSVSLSPPAATVTPRKPVDLVPDSYGITVEPPVGYFMGGFTGDCADGQIDIVARQTAQCTVTATFRGVGTLYLRPTAGADAQPQPEEASFIVLGPLDTPQSREFPVGSDQPMTLSAGRYRVWIRQERFTVYNSWEVSECEFALIGEQTETSEFFVITSYEAFEVAVTPDETTSCRVHLSAIFIPQG